MSSMALPSNSILKHNLPMSAAVKTTIDLQPFVPLILAEAGQSFLLAPSFLEANVLRSFHPILEEALNDGLMSAPHEVESMIRSESERLRRTSALLDLELERLGRQAGEKLPPAIVLKGPAVARLYRTPRLRPYSDMDLLVSRRALADWEQLLERNGYATTNEWKERAWRNYRHHVGFERVVAGALLRCELHTHLLTDRRTIGFGYEQLIHHAVPSEWRQLLYLTPAAQLIVLSLHLAHHRKDGRRLIWYRDFIEIAQPKTVAQSREVARSWQIGWVLEWALSLVEVLIGERRWNAKPPSHQSALMRALELDTPGPRIELAVAREIGGLRGLRYLATKFDPRRFIKQGKFDGREFRSWIRRQIVDTMRATWKGVTRRG